MPAECRYPLQPLLDAAAISMSELRDQFPMSGHTYRNARDVGLTEQQADRYACGVGLVAANVWPEMIDHGIEDVSKRCEECDLSFVPTRSSQRYCTQKCGNRRRARERARNRYQTDPVWREARKTEVRVYREENARAVRIQQASWRDQNRERHRAKQRAYYLANRERILARMAEYDRARRAASNPPQGVSETVAA